MFQLPKLQKMAASQLLISGMPRTFGTVTSDVIIIAGYTNSVKNKCSYKIKESQNCDSFIIRPSGGVARRDVRFDNGNGAHYNGSNL